MERLGNPSRTVKIMDFRTANRKFLALLGTTSMTDPQDWYEWVVHFYSKGKLSAEEYGALMDGPDYPPMTRADKWLIIGCTPALIIGILLMCFLISVN
jgi:hypothetical protein